LGLCRRDYQSIPAKGRKARVSPFQIFALALGLAADAFAAAVCLGMAVYRPKLSQMLTVGLYFGSFQAAMPVIGYAAASLLTDWAMGWGYWAAGGLVAVIGIRMIFESRCKGRGAVKENVCLRPVRMLTLAFATSVDALAAGSSLALVGGAIAPAAATIGVTTLALSMAGVKAGSLSGARFKSKAELIGGAVLLLIGAKIIIDALLNT